MATMAEKEITLGDHTVHVNPEDLDRSQDGKVDVAGRYLAQIALRGDQATLLAPYTPQDEAKVRRKADFIIVPLLLVALMMGSVDKNALGTAAVLGLRTDLGLVGQQYACECLASYTRQKEADMMARVWITHILWVFGVAVSGPVLDAAISSRQGRGDQRHYLGWVDIKGSSQTAHPNSGLISLCIAATSNFAGLAFCRFVLGIFEALTFPVSIPYILI